MNGKTENALQVSLTLVTYADNMRCLGLLALFPLAAFAGEIFTRDGVTDGDTFYLAPAAYVDDDPAFQSWVTYSLMRSTCKLEVGGENPARNSNFECEFDARRELIIAWEEKQQQDPTIADDYLDTLARVYAAGFLAEYTVHYFGRQHWILPNGLRAEDFDPWRREHLQGHKSQTRLTGSWNYAHTVNGTR